MTAIGIIGIIIGAIALIVSSFLLYDRNKKWRDAYEEKVQKFNEEQCQKLLANFSSLYSDYVKKNSELTKINKQIHAWKESSTDDPVASSLHKEAKINHKMTKMSVDSLSNMISRAVSEIYANEKYIEMIKIKNPDSFKKIELWKRNHNL